MASLHLEFSERIDQLINDHKGELQAFDIAASEFVNQIDEVTLCPLRYLFVDGSEVIFDNDKVIFSL